MMIDKPWGYEQHWCATDGYYSKVLYIYAGRRLSLQRHRHRDEWILVTRGRCWVTIGDTRKLLECGQRAYVPRETWHRFEAPPEMTCELVEVGNPSGDDDIERREDDYGRTDGN